MAKICAWQMIVLEQAATGEEIRSKLGLWVMEVMGPYDVVTMVEGDSLEDMHRAAKDIAVLGAHFTTYVAVRTERMGDVERAKCCVLVEAIPPLQERALEAMKNFTGVLRADIVLGPFDMIVLADTELADMREFLDKLRKVDGIVRVMPMYALPS